MDNASVPLPATDKEVARAWIAALRQAVALRVAQRYESPLLAGPRVRAVMAELCPLLADPVSSVSPVTLRAIAAGVSIIHPAALTLILAGALDAPAARRRQQAWQAADREAWLRRQLGTLEEPR